MHSDLPSKPFATLHNLSSRVFQADGSVAVYVDQRSSAEKRFATDFQYKTMRLGYIKIADLYDPAKHDALIEQIGDFLSPARLEWLKLHAIEHLASVILPSLMASAKNERQVFQEAFAFLGEAERELLWEEYELDKDFYQETMELKGRCSQEMAVLDLYKHLLTDPAITIEQLYRPIATLVKQHGEKVCVLIDQENYISFSEVMALEEHAGNKQAFAEKLLHDIWSKRDVDYPLPTEAIFEVNQKREASFTRNFEAMPSYLKELFIATHRNVLIGQTNNPYDLRRRSFSNQKKASAFFNPYTNEIIYGAHAVEHPWIVEEEIVHAVEAELLQGKSLNETRFTDQDAWTKAVDRNRRAFQTKRAFKNIRDEYEGHFGIKKFKFHSHKQRYDTAPYHEALPDIMHIESMLCDMMKGQGNLSGLGFKPSDTVDGVMQKAFGDMYLLYRKTPEGKQLWQRANGAVIMAEQGQDIEDRLAEPVQSFQDICLQRVKALTGKDLLIEKYSEPDSSVTLPLIEHTARAQHSRKSLTVRR